MPGAAPSLAIALSLLAPGCTIALSAAGTAGIDTRENPSVEGRADFFAGLGDGDILYYTSLGVGGGYYTPDAGFFLFNYELGMGVDSVDVRATFGLIYSLRVSNGAFSGFGGAATVYFRLTDDTAEDSHWAVGPRLAISAFEDFTSQTVALFQLSLVLRWVTFDTTRNSWSMSEAPGDATSVATRAW